MTINELFTAMRDNFDALSISEKMLGGALVILLCMCIVFSVLVILMYVIKALRVFGGKKAAETTVTAHRSPQLTAPAQTMAPESDEEEIAAISAAIHAATSASPGRLVVRSITRVADNSSSWAKGSLANQ